MLAEITGNFQQGASAGGIVIRPIVDLIIADAEVVVVGAEHDVLIGMGCSLHITYDIASGEAFLEPAVIELKGVDKTAVEGPQSHRLKPYQQVISCHQVACFLGAAALIAVSRQFPDVRQQAVGQHGGLALESEPRQGKKAREKDSFYHSCSNVFH